MKPVFNYFLIYIILIGALTYINGCSSSSVQDSEKAIIQAFAKEMLAPEDRMYTTYRSDLEAYRRNMDFPLSSSTMQQSFQWADNVYWESVINEQDLKNWNVQIQNYTPGNFKNLVQDTLVFTNEFTKRGGYFDGSSFVGDTMSGKTFIISKPLISSSAALVFYDFSLDTNSISGGSVIFMQQNGEWTKVAHNTLVSTP